MRSLHRTLGLQFLKNTLSSLPDGAYIHVAGAGKRRFPELFMGFNVFYTDREPFDKCDKQYDLLTDPWQREIFDAVLLSEVLEHVSEPKIAIANCRTMLKPAGKLIGTVPYSIALHDEPHDYYRYTEHGLTYLLSDFSRVEITAFGNGSACFWRNRKNPSFPLGYGFVAEK